MTDSAATLPETMPLDSSLSTAKAIMLIVVVALFGYYNSLHGAFVFDDQRFERDVNIGRPFHSRLAARPVVAVTLAINYWLDGYKVRGYHIFNLMVHMAAALTLFDLVRRTLLLPVYGGRYGNRAGWIALAAALIWVIHPLNTQAVTYTVQRCESLAGLFFLVSLWCFLRGATASEKTGWWHAGSVLSCVLGTGCKEAMIVLVPVVLLYDRTFLTGSWVESVRRRWWVYGLLTIPPVIGLAALALTGFFGSEQTVGINVSRFTPMTYAFTETEAVLYYLRLAFWPAGLTMDYLDWPVSTSLADVWPATIGLVVLLGVTTVGVVLRKGWGFLAAGFFLILAPTSTFLPLVDAVVEHRMYLPLAAVVVLVVAGTAEFAARVARRWPDMSVSPVKAVGAVAVSLVVILGVATAARNEDYSSKLRFWHDNVERRPDNLRARSDYVVLLAASGLPELAVEEAHNQDEQNQTRLCGPVSRVDMVVTPLRESGREVEALGWARAFYDEHPDLPYLNAQLGLTLLATGNSGAAVPYLRVALAATEQGDKNGFWAFCVKGVGMPPPETARAETAMHLNLALALYDSGDLAGAAEQFAIVRHQDPLLVKQLISCARRMAEDPESKPIHHRMAVLYARAAQQLEVSASPETLDTLGIALARIGLYPDAVKAAKASADLYQASGNDIYQAKLVRIRAELYGKNRPFLPPQDAK